MKWVEGKYEQRWRRCNRRHSNNWHAWQDILHVMVLTFLVMLFIAVLIWLFIMLMAPKVATAGDIVAGNIVNDTVVMRVTSSMPVVRDSPVAVKPRTRPAPPVKSVSRESAPVKVLYMEISCYSPTAAETDGNPLRTASGQRVRVGGIAADLRILPFGSLVRIPGYNGGDPCMVIDTGGSIRGNKIDVFMWSAHEAVHWGRRRNVPVQVLFIPKATP